MNDTVLMEGVHLLTIKNSKKKAIRSKWKDPGAKLYDHLLDSTDYGGSIPTSSVELDQRIADGKYRSYWDFLKEAYLEAPVKEIENSPHGRTPFSQSGCKYPHHIIRGEELLLHVEGLKKAYDQAFRNRPMGHGVQAHLDRHFEELGITVRHHHGQIHFMEAHELQIEDNFAFIESFIDEQWLEGSDYLNEGLLAGLRKIGIRIVEFFRRLLRMRKGLNVLRLSDLSMLKRMEAPLLIIGTDIMITDMKSDSYRGVFESGEARAPLTDEQMMRVIRRFEEHFNHKTLIVSEKSPEAVKKRFKNTAASASAIKEKDLRAWFPDDVVEEFLASGTNSIRGDQGYNIIVLNLLNIGPEQRTVEILHDTFAHEFGHVMTINKLTETDMTEYHIRRQLISALFKYHNGSDDEKFLFGNLAYRSLKPEKLADDYSKIDVKKALLTHLGKGENLSFPNGFESSVFAKVESLELPEHILKLMSHCMRIDGRRRIGARGIREAIEFSKTVYREILPQEAASKVMTYLDHLWNTRDKIEEFIKESVDNAERKDYEMKRLPELYKKLIRSTNSVVIDEMEKLIKEPKYKRLNNPATIKELKTTIGAKNEWVGHIWLQKFPRKYEGWITITYAKQHWDFFDLPENKIPDDQKPDTKGTIYMLYYDLMKEIEKNLKPLFKGYKEVGLNFLLRGDPIDQIHEFEFELEDKTAKDLWEYIVDGKKEHLDTPLEGFEELFKEAGEVTKGTLKRLSRTDATSSHVVQWFFSIPEWKGYEEKFDFSRLVDDSKNGYHAYGYLLKKKIEATLCVNEKPDGRHHISMFYVNPIRQSQGLGQDFMVQIIEKHGSNPMSLNVIVDNIRAIHVYEKFGFVKGEKRLGPRGSPGYYRMTRQPQALTEAALQEIFMSGDFSAYRCDDEVLFKARGEIDLLDEGLGEVTCLKGLIERVDRMTSDPNYENFDDDLSWIEGHLMTEAPEEEEKPKWVDDSSKSPPKNGANRKRLYMLFIEWAKKQNSKNTFGNVFDKDAFTVTYPFVPHDLRYFYRLANPMLCTLGGGLVFFALQELKKLNAENKKIDELFIFGATQNDVRVYRVEDRKIYQGVDENGELKLTRCYADSFDLYLQELIGGENVLNVDKE